MTKRVIIHTLKAPAALGTYNQAVLVDKTLYVSGQVGLVPSTMEFISDDAAAQARQALTNIGEILRAAGSDYNRVVKATVLLADINDFVTVNNVYKEFFSVEKAPARAAFEAANLPKFAKVEIEAVAIVGDLVDEPMSKL